MNKKIKVIELLNKIANNEKLPVKIMFNTVAWELMKDEKDYRSTHTQERLLKDDNWILRHLNVEVEILKDEEEIDIQGINENDYRIEYHSKDIFTTENLNDLFYKVAFEIMRNRNEQNEILKAVKQLDKKINKEE